MVCFLFFVFLWFVCFCFSLFFTFKDDEITKIKQNNNESWKDEKTRLEARLRELEGNRCSNCLTKASRSANINESQLLTFKRQSPSKITRDIADLIRIPLRNVNAAAASDSKVGCTDNEKRPATINDEVSYEPSCSKWHTEPLKVQNSVNRTNKAMLVRLESTCLGESPPKESILLSPIRKTPPTISPPKIRVNDITVVNPVPVYIPAAFLPVEEIVDSPELQKFSPMKTRSKFFRPLKSPETVVKKRPLSKSRADREQKPMFRRLVGNIGRPNRAFKLRLQASPNVKHDHKTGTNREISISTDDFNEMKNMAGGSKCKDSPFAKLFSNIGRRNKRRSGVKRKSGVGYYVSKYR